MIYLVLEVFFVTVTVNVIAFAVYIKRDFALAGGFTVVTFMLATVLFCGAVSMLLTGLPEDNYIECAGKMPADKAGYCDRYLAGENGGGL